MESFLQLFRELMLNHHHCGPSVQPLLMETILQQNLFTVFYAVHITVLIINLTLLCTSPADNMENQYVETHDAENPGC